jgi:type VI secretion system protein
MRSRPSVLFTVILALALVCGCSLAKSKAKAIADAKAIANRVILRPSPLDLQVGIDEGANRNSPVAMDVVLIKDKNFWKAAQEMSANDWFAHKSDLQRRYNKKLQVSSWEWVPGQAVAPITVKIPRRMNGAMVYAAYPSPGTHSAPLPAGGKISISLQREDFTIEASK